MLLLREIFANIVKRYNPVSMMDVDKILSFVEATICILFVLALF